MVNKLKKKFIKIAMISVTAVLVIFGTIINIANFVFVDSKLDSMLNVISENKGRIPENLGGKNRPEKTDEPTAPDGQTPPGEKTGNFSPMGGFSRESAYSTRYFVLFYSSDGTLDKAELENIASVRESDAGEYINIILSKNSNSGYTNGFKYKVTETQPDKRMAVFLDCSDELSSLKSIALLSVISTAVCIIGVYIAVKIFAGRAVDPVVQSTLRQKQFITDASHELKTPITVIGTSLKVLEMETGKQKWIDKALLQTEKLTRLVNSLVSLARTDEESSNIQKSGFDISAAVTETAESFRDFAKSNGHDLIITNEEGIIYNGDEYACRQLISILLDNAVKYSLPSSPIKLSLKKTRKGVEIKQSNACEKIDEKELGKLFDRFYRVDKSRSSSGGFGIGLSMAKSVALAHSGSIKATAPSENEIEFTVILK